MKDDVVRARGFKVLRTAGEDVCEFTYRPGACRADYRVVALRKPLGRTGRERAVQRVPLVLLHHQRRDAVS